jgi:phenylpyruvate tautomerase PptA (4-oxalocrotonate tautomerase family)
MPLIKIFTSRSPPSAEHAAALLRTLSKSLAELTGKPEAYVMTCLVPQASMTFGGSSEPACYGEVKSIGRMDPERVAKMSERLCRELSEALGVPQSRIYLEFKDVEARLWAHGGETFG